MQLFLWFAILVVSLCVFVKASGYFINCAEKVGVWLGIPPFIIGVSIVAIGTSLPELISSIVAVLRGSSEIVVGNVIGSNVANVFLIMGIATIAVGRLTTAYELARVDLPLLVGSALLLAVTIWDGEFVLPEALLCIAGGIIYLGYTSSARNGVERDTPRATGKPDAKLAIGLLAGAALIYLGARYTVESAVKVSRLLGIGTELVAVSAIAFGTSLPELTVTVSAARKGKAGIALGNILGSNIYNVFAVMGVPALFGKLIIPDNMLTFGLPMMLIATLLCFVMTQVKVVTKWEGWLLILFYLFFIGKLFCLF